MMPDLMDDFSSQICPANFIIKIICMAAEFYYPQEFIILDKGSKFKGTVGFFYRIYYIYHHHLITKRYVYIV